MEYENRTHCPNCKRSYTISEARLATPNLSVKCPACQTRFLAAENVTYAPKHDAQARVHSTPASSKSRTTNQPSKTQTTPDAQQSSPQPNVSPHSTIDPNFGTELDLLGDTTSVLDEDLDALLADLSGKKAPKIQKSPTGTIPNTGMDKLDADELLSKLDIPIASVPTQEHEDDEAWLSALLDNNSTNGTQHDAIPRAPIPTPIHISKTSSSQSKALRQGMFNQVLWALGSFLLLALLVAQYASFNVDNLVKDPKHRATLSAACQILSCTLPSADINAFTVQSIHRPSAHIEGQTDIAGYLNNQSVEQLYPDLLITLHGKDGVVGEALVAPKDYLVVDARLIASGAHVPFLLTLDAPNSEVERVDVRAVY